jgi:3'-phosphoadenosine 5'-phosphosulfate sulfotransferase (PAPS reductase)/FAD synthetase
MPAGVYDRLSGEAMKRRLATLKAAQSAPLAAKVEQSRAIIESLPRPLVVLFSGGRDSSVVAKLTQDLNPVLLYCETGLQSQRSADEIERTAQRVGARLVIVRPDTDAFTMWQELGHYPIGPKRGYTYLKAATGCKTSPVQCCYQLKERPAKKWIMEHKPGALLWGNRAADSNRRKLGIAEHGLVQPPSARWPCVSAQPIAFWTDKDVSAFLGPEWPVRKAEDGCAVCCTDLARPDNQLTRTYLHDRSAFDAAIRSGLGQQILIARGEGHLDAEQVLQAEPVRFLRIPKYGKG